MKKLLALLMFVGLSSQAAELVKGVDFTGRNGASAATLNALVDNATLAANRGMIISTNADPAVGVLTYLTNYVFLDWSLDPPQLKTWSASGSSWESATVGANTITSAMIVNGAIANADLGSAIVATANIQDAAITTAKLVDSSVSNAKIANNAITSAKITDGSIVTDDLASASVNSDKIVDSSIATVDIANLNVTREKLALGAVDTTTITNATIKLEDMAVDGGTAYQRVRMNSGATAWEWFTQPVPVVDAVANSTFSTALAFSATPASTEGVEIATLTVNITKSNSKVRLTDFTSAYNDSNSGGAAIALFRGSTFLTASVYSESNNGYSGTLSINYIDTPGAGSIVYSVRAATYAAGTAATTSAAHVGQFTAQEIFTEAP